MTSRFDKMTVVQLKAEQKKRGILDTDIKGQGKNGTILKFDRVVALDKHEEKKSKKTAGSKMDKSTESKVVPKSKPKSSTKKASKSKPKKASPPKKLKTPSKGIFVLTYQIRDDHGNQYPSGVLTASTLEKLKAVVQQYIFAHRNDEEYIEDENFSEEAVMYTLDMIDEAYNKNKASKESISISPELNSLYTAVIFKNVPYQP